MMLSDACCFARHERCDMSSCKCECHNKKELDDVTDDEPITRD
jgi:hypothetical protein